MVGVSIQISIVSIPMLVLVMIDISVIEIDTLDFYLDKAFASIVDYV